MNIKYISLSALLLALIISPIIAFKVYHSNSDISFSDFTSCIKNGGKLTHCFKKPRKELFVAKCINNNHDRSGCSCNYTAMKDPLMPSEFDNIIIAWAHKTPNELYTAYAVTFGDKLISEVTGESGRIARQKFMNVFSKARKIAYGRAVSELLKKRSNGILKKILYYIRKKGIGYRLAASHQNANIIYVALMAGDIASEFTRYKVVMDHHCGGKFGDVYDYYVKYDKFKDGAYANVKNALNDYYNTISETYKSTSDVIEKYAGIKIDKDAYMKKVKNYMWSFVSNKPKKK